MVAGGGRLLMSIFREVGMKKILVGLGCCLAVSVAAGGPVKVLNVELGKDTVNMLAYWSHGRHDNGYNAELKHDMFYLKQEAPFAGCLLTPVVEANSDPETKVIHGYSFVLKVAALGTGTGCRKTVNAQFDPYDDLMTFGVSVTHVGDTVFRAYEVEDGKGFLVVATDKVAVENEKKRLTYQEWKLKHPK